ncbi:DMT family transporter [Niallia sp. RD1]|uniref:DMT family transporter n=1 Tax=Niallia sp. RD1 TaxID=2962858 RepID=UPI0020C1A723|nr:DMT family transporter [Niallia sp. RD1]UTI41026.1 DMT family transporter [Niallia sp. RD1]
MTQKQANLLLATVSLGWGTSYIFMKLLVDSVSPFTVVALRFGIAFLVMIVIFYKKLISVNTKILKYSAIVGALLCGIFIALMYGMKTTTASSAGFLTSTTVILVPILQTLITGKLPRKEITYGVITVSIGLSLLTITNNFTFALGSLLCLVAALLYAVHIIVTNYFVQELDALQFGMFQLGFASIYATIGIFLFETPALPIEAVEWLALLGLAIICSAYGFVMQPIAQKYTTPESTGFVFSLEPVFSAIFAFIFLSENMGGQGYLGALLILVGVLIANLPSKKQMILEEIKE